MIVFASPSPMAGKAPAFTVARQMATAASLENSLIETIVDNPCNSNI
jgi:hypothetical protein